LFNFNNFNSRLPASSHHQIKYFNPKKAHPCVIPRILGHHASKSVKVCGKAALIGSCDFFYLFCFLRHAWSLRVPQKTK